MEHHKHCLTSRKVGFSYETLTCKFLQKHNLKILLRNYCCRAGEIDIIAKDQDTVVFVEVKFRRQKKYGEAQETVNYQKQRRIIKAALHFLVVNKLAEKVACRFDVVAIHHYQGKSPQLSWIKNAFEA